MTMTNEIERTNRSKEAIPPLVSFESTLSLLRGNGKAMSDDARASIVLDQLISRRPQEILSLQGASGPDSGKPDRAAAVKLVQDHLTERLAKTCEDFWDFVPKSIRDLLLQPQFAVTTGDLKKLAEYAKTFERLLKGEGADRDIGKTALMVAEENLRRSGAKTHLKFVADRFLLYRDNGKEAVAIGKDGKASVVAIEPNEPKGPPRILKDQKPFSTVPALKKEIVDNTVNEIYKNAKAAKFKEKK
jgi:hypothetical protein